MDALEHYGWVILLRSLPDHITVWELIHLYVMYICSIPPETYIYPHTALGMCVYVYSVQHACMVCVYCIKARLFMAA